DNTDTLLNIDGILASFHNDTLTGTGSGNYIEARDGDDTIYMPDVNGAYVDGGLGQDTLIFNDTGANVDATLGGFEVHGIETVDLTGTGENFLTLSAEDVVNIGESNSDFTSLYAENLVILGDDDHLTLAGDWQPAETDSNLARDGAGTFNIYNYSVSG